MPSKKPKTEYIEIAGAQWQGVVDWHYTQTPEPKVMNEGQKGHWYLTWEDGHWEVTWFPENFLMAQNKPTNYQMVTDDRDLESSAQLCITLNAMGAA